MPNHNTSSPRNGSQHHGKRGVIEIGTTATATATALSRKSIFLAAAIIAAACIATNILIIHIVYDDIIAVSYDPIAFPVENYLNNDYVDTIVESRGYTANGKGKTHSDECYEESVFERIVLREGHFLHRRRHQRQRQRQRQQHGDNPRNHDDDEVTSSSPSLLYLPEALRPTRTNTSSTTTETTNQSHALDSITSQEIISQNGNKTKNQTDEEKHDHYQQICCHMPDDKTDKILMQMKPDKFCWYAVCHTPRACNDTIYPFSDQSQKDYFRLQHHDKSEKMSLRRKCDERNGMLVPPYKWCAQWMSQLDGDYSRMNMDYDYRNDDYDDLMKADQINVTNLERYNHKNIDPFEAELPPPGCSLISQGGGSGSYQNVILFPEGKLAFCGIPKVGITQWIQFLRFTLGARDYRAHPHSKRDQRLLRFDSMREEVQMEILNDPEWKFAVFLRDPEERLLSAYLDKVRPNGGNDDIVANHFKSQFNFSESPTFAEFVETIAMNRTRCPTGRGSRRDKLYGADWCADPHWRPQTMSCGISEFLPRISYIGSMNHIHSQTRTVLKGHLWERYGKYFHWDPKFEAEGEEDVCATPPPTLKAGDTLIGFQQRPLDFNRSSSCLGNGVVNRQEQIEVPSSATSDGSAKSVGAHHHATGSQSKVDRFYTPRLRRLVRDIYRRDYELWNLIKNENHVVSGSEIAMKISGTCKTAAVHLARGVD